MYNYNNRKPWLWLTIYILLYYFQTHPSFATISIIISSNQSLSGDQTLVSEGGVFELGFFKPGISSNNYYIGMWYKKVSVRTYVWVANRDQPVSDKNTANLTILEGNLVLLDETQIPVWSTNLTTTTNSSSLTSLVAVLLDDGNLILRDNNNNNNNNTSNSNPPPLWQSFDHPTDTFLPGGKLKLDKKTNQPQYLTSWKNNEDPGTGLYSLGLDPKETNAYHILWNRSEMYWTSGPWNGQIFSLVPEMRLNYIYNFSFFTNENETYFTYSLYNTSIISRFLIDVSGQIQQLTWLETTQQWNLFWAQPRRTCDVYNFCGAFGSCNDNSLPFCTCLTGFEPKLASDWNLGDFSAGCLRIDKLQCEKPNPSSNHKKQDDGFLEINNVELPKHDHQLVGAEDAGECESACLKNCSCDAYAYDSNDGCSIWYGDLFNLQQPSSSGDASGKTLYLKLAPSELDDDDASKGISRKLLLFFIIGVIILTSVVILICVVVYIRRRRKIARREEGETIQRNRGRFYDSERYVKDLIDEGDLEEKDNEGIEVPYFDFESIQAATNNFSNANKLGRGGYGPVYKGILPDGQVVAVKRLSSSSSQGLREFKNEVVLIAKLQHRDLVRLRGYCIKGNEKLLLYEYMPNRSLDSFIFDRNQSVVLNWQMRLDIIRGVARGMLYLHQDSRLRVIHRDLKTSNILLDENMRPKISDFGLAKIFGYKETEANSERIVGTYGYMSPEAVLQGIFSTKSDIFSFGVVLLEIISGQKNKGFYQSEQQLSLLGYAWRLWTENKVLDLMDMSVGESCINVNEFRRCVHIGLLCVQDHPIDRPSMAKVVTMLDIESLPPPKQPTFYERKGLSSNGGGGGGGAPSKVISRASSSSKVATSLIIDSSYQQGR